MRLPVSPNLPPETPRLLTQLTKLWRQLADWSVTLGIDNLTDGNVPVWNAAQGYWQAGSGANQTYVGPSPPPSPTVNMTWIDSSTGIEYVYYDDGSSVQWVSFGTPGITGSGMTNPMTTVGDLIVGGASGAPTRVAAGTATYVWTANGAGVAPTWQAPAAGGSGAMTLVGTATVTGSAATTLTMSGLDLATDGCYVMHAIIKSAVGSSANVSLYFNGDTTAANYVEQVLSADSTTVAGVRGVDAIAATMEGTAAIFLDVVTRRDLDGIPRSFVRNTRGAGTTTKLQQFSHMRNNTANVTSITLSSSVASALAVGSYFKLFKVVG